MRQAPGLSRRGAAGNEYNDFGGMKMFSKKSLEVFRNPKNIGFIKDADGVGRVGNPACGNIMWVYIKVKEENGKEIIADVKVKTFGCVAAIATASTISEMAIGKTLDDALKITKDEVADALDGLPPEKIHCAVLSQQGLRAAIEDYRNKKAKAPN